MPPTTPCNLAQAYPPELVEYAIYLGNRSGNRVIAILDFIFGAPTPGNLKYFSPDFLLDLAAASQLDAWERDGITVHIEDGLPSADEAFRQVFRDELARATNPAAPSTGPALDARVFRLQVERMAWRAPMELEAEVAIGVLDPETVADALASLLWNTRHTAILADREATR